MKWTVFAMQKTDFHEFELFAEKVIFMLKCQKYHFFRASKEHQFCVSATKQIDENVRPQMLKSFFLLSQKKVAKCNFKSKAHLNEKIILSNEINCFLQCRRQIFMSLSFWQKKVILVLKCTNHFLELLRTPILCLVQIMQIMRMWGHRCSKASFSVRKSC